MPPRWVYQIIENRSKVSSSRWIKHIHTDSHDHAHARLETEGAKDYSGPPLGFLSPFVFLLASD